MADKGMDEKGIDRMMKKERGLNLNVQTRPANSKKWIVIAAIVGLGFLIFMIFIFYQPLSRKDLDKDDPTGTLAK